MERRKPRIAIISDTHIGTFGCKAKELLAYLNSINPDCLILNGDIIDGWHFRAKRFHKDHMRIFQRILSLALDDKEIIYIAGNHDEFLRKFLPMDLPNFKIVNKIIKTIDGKKTWIFHGDVFDNSVNYSKWIAQLGGKGYDFLIWLNYQINRVFSFFNLPKRSFSKRVKEGVKGAIKYINNFEQVAAEIAYEEGYDTVICGHIHVPQDRILNFKGKDIRYLNSGDWVENLTALEYDNKEWKIVHYQEEFSLPNKQKELSKELEIMEANN